MYFILVFQLQRWSSINGSDLLCFCSFFMRLRGFAAKTWRNIFSFNFSSYPDLLVMCDVFCVFLLHNLCLFMLIIFF